MESRTTAIAARLAGGLGLAALLLYGGIALGVAAPDALQAVLYVVLAVVLTWLATWGLARLSASRTAAWAALAATGVAPVAAFVGWFADGEAGPGVIVGILWFNLVAGVLALAATGWHLVTAREGAGTRRRTPRVS